ncbi:MAG TPA: glucan biosynthesis protein G [Methylobacterium sp.]|jgi:glucans biosynthesis protein|uniref:glucan biosynthesis protein G n=1 Tax=Methylorubrum sp. B1-46 TaxID=2897334 RepID=UPI001E3995EC|nr:glucan biosynthesis protein G [Methylorubrum sp. B1-46]UGB27943.1 glucan biosynthesis protein G [Methylorubrum sp. B1-46]HEV2542328.1 glucan biosynthesis protein G [Methylobacterium sp.]
MIRARGQNDTKDRAEATVPEAAPPDAPSRRAVMSGLAAAGLTAVLPAVAVAQGEAAGVPFDPFTLERQAQALAAKPFDGGFPPLPPPLAGLDYDAYRDIRFRKERAFLGEAGGPFRLQLFHRGFLYPRPVAVSLVRDGISTPIAYDPALFDFGRTRIEGTLPRDLNFAGIRIHAPLNRPDRLDELIVFVGASYFRFLGQDQLYGLSARGLAIGTEGDKEEFPFFRAFFIEVPPAGARALTIHALLDSPSVAGAYRFTVEPGRNTTTRVSAVLYPRQDLGSVGLAPLTSMYFIGETDRGHSDDYRPELHDSDGLQIATGSGEWLWRPLDNPQNRRISTFLDRDPKGFGLMQRDRHFANYQDLEAGYERRPGYFVEPEGAWGEGSVVLMELPTDNETADNIVAFWRPKQPYPAGRPVRLAYAIRAHTGEDLHPNGKVLNTFIAEPAASGAARKAGDPAADLVALRSRRFLIDFGGGDLGKGLDEASPPEIVASASQGRITATSIVPNPHIGGYRVALDVRLDGPGTAELRAYLRKGDQALTETWSFPWSAA